MCILMTDSFMMKYEAKVLEKVVLKEGWFVIRLVCYQGFHSTNTSNSNTSSGTVLSAERVILVVVLCCQLEE